jgi:hypothetical protein
VNYTAANPAAATLLLLGLVTGAQVAAGPLVRVTLPPPTETRVVDPPPAPRIAAESLGRPAVARDPFRFARRPVAVAYDPMRIGQAPVPTPPKPMLMLVGIVWDGGKDPTALLEGLPGTDGPRSLRTGEVVNALHVKRIDRDRVVIVGLDTTWTLTVREPWK